jgi:hypothetical protein
MTSGELAWLIRLPLSSMQQDKTIEAILTDLACEERDLDDAKAILRAMEQSCVGEQCCAQLLVAWCPSCFNPALCAMIFKVLPSFTPAASHMSLASEVIDAVLDRSREDRSLLPDAWDCIAKLVVDNAGLLAYSSSSSSNSSNSRNSNVNSCRDDRVPTINDTLLGAAKDTCRWCNVDQSPAICLAFWRMALSADSTPENNSNTFSSSSGGGDGSGGNSVNTHVGNPAIFWGQAALTLLHTSPLTLLPIMTLTAAAWAARLSSTALHGLRQRQLQRLTAEVLLFWLALATWPLTTASAERALSSFQQRHLLSLTTLLEAIRLLHGSLLAPSAVAQVWLLEVEDARENIPTWQRAALGQRLLRLMLAWPNDLERQAALTLLLREQQHQEHHHHQQQQHTISSPMVRVAMQQVLQVAPLCLPRLFLSPVLLPSWWDALFAEDTSFVGRLQLAWQLYHSVGAPGLHLQATKGLGSHTGSIQLGAIACVQILWLKRDGGGNGGENAPKCTEMHVFLQRLLRLSTVMEAQQVLQLVPAKVLRAVWESDTLLPVTGSWKIVERKESSDEAEWWSHSAAETLATELENDSHADTDNSRDKAKATDHRNTDTDTDTGTNNQQEPCLISLLPKVTAAGREESNETAAVDALRLCLYLTVHHPSPATRLWWQLPPPMLSMLHHWLEWLNHSALTSSFHPSLSMQPAFVLDPSRVRWDVVALSWWKANTQQAPKEEGAQTMVSLPLLLLAAVSDTEPIPWSLYASDWLQALQLLQAVLEESLPQGQVIRTALVFKTVARIWHSLADVLHWGFVQEQLTGGRGRGGGDGGGGASLLSPLPDAGMSCSSQPPMDRDLPATPSAHWQPLYQAAMTVMECCLRGMPTLIEQGNLPTVRRHCRGLGQCLQSLLQAARSITPPLAVQDLWQSCRDSLRNGPFSYANSLDLLRLLESVSEGQRQAMARLALLAFRAPVPLAQVAASENRKALTGLVAYIMRELKSMLRQTGGQIPTGGLSLAVSPSLRLCYRLVSTLQNSTSLTTKEKTITMTQCLLQCPSHLPLATVAEGWTFLSAILVLFRQSVACRQSSSQKEKRSHRVRHSYRSVWLAVRGVMSWLTTQPMLTELGHRQITLALLRGLQAVVADFFGDLQSSTSPTGNINAAAEMLFQLQTSCSAMEQWLSPREEDKTALSEKSWDLFVRVGSVLNLNGKAAEGIETLSHARSGDGDGEEVSVPYLLSEEEGMDAYDQDASEDGASLSSLDSQEEEERLLAGFRQHTNSAGEEEEAEEEEEDSDNGNDNEKGTVVEHDRVNFSVLAPPAKLRRILPTLQRP